MLRIREVELEGAYASLDQLLQQVRDQELIANMQSLAEDDETIIDHSEPQHTRRSGHRDPHEAHHDQCKAAYRHLLQLYRQEQCENEHLREEQNENEQLRDELEESEERRKELEEILREITEATERGMLYGHGRYGIRGRGGRGEWSGKVTHLPQLPFI